jgi:hypothetical protein
MVFLLLIVDRPVDAEPEAIDLVLMALESTSLEGCLKTLNERICRHALEPRITSGAGAGIQMSPGFSGPPGVMIIGLEDLAISPQDKQHYRWRYALLS